MEEKIVRIKEEREESVSAESDAMLEEKESSAVPDTENAGQECVADSLTQEGQALLEQEEVSAVGEEETVSAEVFSKQEDSPDSQEDAVSSENRRDTEGFSETGEGDIPVNAEE